jgi:hypothetical protein
MRTLGEGVYLLAGTQKGHPCTGDLPVEEAERVPDADAIIDGEKSIS